VQQRHGVHEAAGVGDHSPVACEARQALHGGEVDEVVD
jgi:hypothetical protein